MASFSLIVDRIVNECVKLGILEELKKYIINYYNISLYAAHLDILSDGSYNFESIKTKDKELLAKYAFLSSSNYSVLPFKISFFIFLYKRCNILVPLCLKIRSFILQK